MFLQSIQCEAPPASFTQEDCLAILRESERFHRLKDRSKHLLAKILAGPGGIEKRHFAMPEVERLFDLDAAELNRGFEREAPRLAAGALEGAMRKAGVSPAEVDALLVCTCTGYLCPGVSSHVAERLGLRPDVFLSDLVGLGCGAAIPMLRQAESFARADPEATIACVAVEVCSAAFYLDDDPGVLVSLCLFGDGAAATLWRGRDRSPEGDGVRCGGFDTLHVPEDRHLLRFENEGGKLRNRLHRSVPERAAAAVRELYDRRRKGDGDGTEEVVSHAGGRDVLDAVAGALGRGDLPESREVLRDYGNMSSPSVLFALDRFLAGKNGGPMSVWASSFGAGFSCHSCRFDRPADGPTPPGTV